MPNNLGKYLHPPKKRTTDINLPSPAELETKALMVALADKRAKKVVDDNKANPHMNMGMHRPMGKK